MLRRRLGQLFYHSKDFAASWDCCVSIAASQVFAVLRDVSTVPCFVMHQGAGRTVVYVAMDAVAGARRTPGRHKTGGAPPKPPATLFLFVPSNVLGLRFIVSRRRGVVEAVCRGSGKILVRSDGFRPIGVRARCGVFLASCCGGGTQCLCGRCGVLTADCCGSGQLSNTDVAASQSVCSCGAVPGQSPVSSEDLCRVVNSLEEFSQISQGKIVIGQEAVSICGRTRKLLDWAGKLHVRLHADPAAPKLAAEKLRMWFGEHL